MSKGVRRKLQQINVLCKDACSAVHATMPTRLYVTTPSSPLSRIVYIWLVDVDVTCLQCACIYRCVSHHRTLQVLKAKDMFNSGVSDTVVTVVKDSEMEMLAQAAEARKKAKAAW